MSNEGQFGVQERRIDFPLPRLRERKVAMCNAIIRLKTHDGTVVRHRCRKVTIFSADETTDVGYDAGTPVSAGAPQGKFTETINWVQLDLGDDAHDQLVDPAHAMRVAMSLQ